MSLPEGYTFRKVQVSDYSHYVETLRVLTTVGDVSESQFVELVVFWTKHPEIYHPGVISDTNNEVVATGMLVVEQKLIHECGKVGHIEDIAVTENQQGKKLGNALIGRLTDIAHKEGCYKVILDCSPENAGFYEKCGYSNAGIQMTKRYD